ncbi:MAG TPA: hypothetical protein VIB49_06585 [Thermoplasmata archaeon]
MPAEPMPRAEAVREVPNVGTAVSAPGADVAACDVCGGPAVERHCKILCLRCGYTRDCSDP